MTSTEGLKSTLKEGDKILVTIVKETPLTLQTLFEMHLMEVDNIVKVENLWIANI